jgi:hypothetical protein
MSTLLKLMLIPAAVIAVAVGVALAGAGGSGTTSLPVGTNVGTVENVGTVGDVSGPCDEAEHANDPRCTGVAQDDRRGRDGRGDDGREVGEDVSGPCDEAEHANDPRCTGAGGERDDNSGPGSSNSGHGSDD